ncbi:MAG: fimbria/pilus outer membrane usher protein, partial [Aeromonadaceae bacterium]
LALGLAEDVGSWGALAGDVTLARATPVTQAATTGYATRVQYQKQFSHSGTAISLASYRYSSRHFYDFADLYHTDPENPVPMANRRARAEILLTQNLQRYGTLSAAVYQQAYWQSGRRDQTLHLGYYNSYRSLSWSLGYYDTRNAADGSRNRSVSLNISLPLGSRLPDSALAYNLTHDQQGAASQQVALYGSLLEQRNLYYSLQQGYDSRQRSLNSNLALDYRAGYGDASLGYGRDNAGQRLNYGLSGGVLATGYGVTFSQPLGETVALVRAEGAGDVQVEGSSNVHTDRRGYAVMPALSPYHKNTLSLDTESLPQGTDLEQNSQLLVPTRGAVVLADYRTHIGRRVLLQLHHAGRPLPFGSEVYIRTHRGAGRSSNHGMVGEDGEVYLSGVPAQGVLHARWQHDGVLHHCQSPWQSANDDSAATVQRLVADCHE